jgi:MFS transporter, FHS family, glucose/mannose:H+ symporter
VVTETTQIRPTAVEERTGFAGVSTPAALVLFVLLGALYASLGATLPQLRTEFHLAPTAGSELVTWFMAGSLVTTLGAGFAARWLRARPTLSVLLVLIGVGAIAMSLAPSWSLFLLSAAAAGLGFGGIVVYLNTAFASGFGRRSVVMLNLLNAVFMGGAIAGPLAIGAATGIGVRYVFLGIGILVLACWPIRGCVPPAPDQRTPGRGYSAAAARRYLPILAAFAVVGLAYGAMETSVGTWESTDLVSVGVSASAAALWTGAYWAGHALGRVSLPFLSLRMSASRLVILCTVGAAIALASASVPSFAPYSYAAAGILLGPVYPTMLAWALRITPAKQLTAALMFASSMIGTAGSPPVIAAVISGRTGPFLPLSLSALAAICIASIMLASAVSRFRSQARAEPEPALG